MMILAIDLGKCNSMCCSCETSTQEHRFQAAACVPRFESETACHACWFFHALKQCRSADPAANRTKVITFRRTASGPW